MNVRFAARLSAIDLQLAVLLAVSNYRVKVLQVLQTKVLHWEVLQLMQPKVLHRWTCPGWSKTGLGRTANAGTAATQGTTGITAS